MKAQLNAVWKTVDTEVDIFRKMSNILKVNYHVAFIEETHQHSITYYSPTVRRNAIRELSDLWIIAFSPSKKRIKTTFLQAKYHNSNILLARIFRADFFQFELLSTRPSLLKGSIFNFPPDALSFGCCNSVGCYGVFYIDSTATIDMAYCSANLLTNRSVAPKRYRQAPVNLVFPSVPISVSNCNCNVCTELNYTYDIDFFTQNLLELNIGAELQVHPQMLSFVKNIMIRMSNTIAINQLINTIDSFVESGLWDMINESTKNINPGNPNIFIINVDEKASD